MQRNGLSILLRLLVLLVFASTIASSIHAQQNLARQGFGRWHRGMFGVKAGAVYTGTLRLNGKAYDTRIGIYAGVFWDVPVTPWLMAGAAADIVDIQAFDQRQGALDVSLALKLSLIHI